MLDRPKLIIYPNIIFDFTTMLLLLLTERVVRQNNNTGIQIYEAQYNQHDIQFDQGISGTCITARYVYIMFLTKKNMRITLQAGTS